MKKLPFLCLALCAAIALAASDSPRVSVLNNGWQPGSPKRPSIPLFNQFADLPTILNAYEAEELLLSRLHFPEPSQWNHPEDSVYILPTQEDIDDMVRVIRKRQENLGYTSQAFDCDDFATEGKYLATIWSVRRFSRTRAALLFGKAYVKLDGDYGPLMPGLKGQDVTGYHVLNFFVRNDGQVFFFEPQTLCAAPVESLIYEGVIEVLKVEY